MTARILRGLSHPKVKILGHPTGRLLNHRPSYDVDWPKVFAFCRQHHKILEINAHPYRLDLPDTLIRQAIKAGVKLIINTDSQSSIQLITQVLENPNDPHDKINHISTIRKIVELIISKKYGIIIRKVKAHVGIVGNEIADRLASIGRTRKEQPPIKHTEYHNTAVLIHPRRTFIKKRWKNIM